MEFTTDVLSVGNLNTSLCPVLTCFMCSINLMKVYPSNGTLLIIVRLLLLVAYF